MNINKKILLGTLVSTATIGIAATTSVIVAKVTKKVYVAQDISSLLDGVDSNLERLSVYKEGLISTFVCFFNKGGKPLDFSEIKAAKDFESAKKAADKINHNLYVYDTHNPTIPTILTILGQTIKPGVFVPKSIHSKIQVWRVGGEATKSFVIPSVMLKQMINMSSDKALILETIQQYTFNNKNISSIDLNKIQNAKTLKEAKGITINLIKGNIVRKSSKKLTTIITISGVFKNNSKILKRLDLNRVITNIQNIPNSTEIQGVIEKGNEGRAPQYIKATKLANVLSFDKPSIKLKDYIKNLISKFKGFTDNKGWDLNFTKVRNSKTEEEALKAAKDIIPFIVKK